MTNSYKELGDQKKFELRTRGYLEADGLPKALVRNIRREVVASFPVTRSGLSLHLTGKPHIMWDDDEVREGSTIGNGKRAVALVMADAAGDPLWNKQSAWRTATARGTVKHAIAYEQAALRDGIQETPALTAGGDEKILKIG